MPKLTRVALVFIAFTGIVVGGWALFFPLTFYSAFPGIGTVPWVSADGPYNGHLVRDTGAAYLMTAGLGGLGLLRPDLATPCAVGFATLCFNVPHFVYHMSMLQVYPPIDQALNVVTLLTAVLASVWLILPRAQMPRQ